MILKNINHSFGYHTEKIASMFFPLEKIKSDGESDIVVETKIDANSISVDAAVFSKRKKAFCKTEESEDRAHALSVLLYKVLSDITGFAPPWGILYGVRPARLMHATVERLGVSGARDKFLGDLVQPEKIDLALEVMNTENKIISLSKENSFSLYVSIPFCPSRYAYCSFVSHSIANARDLIEPYIKLLCAELKRIGEIAEKLDLRLETIYFGGGTPSTLSAEQLNHIFSSIENYFDLSSLREYTVEAGRPDTITEAKLSALLSHKVKRISINPQTFNDDVLNHIGRKHTSEQTFEAFNLARKLGFNNINTDLIAGLNGDTLDSFKNSVNTAVCIGAESVTVHNLSLKSGAYLVTENENYDLALRKVTSDMVDFAYEKLKFSGYNPYYMYRQSKSLGNLENVGYAKKGYACLYNVFMMDETHSVLAAGAGAVTMLKRQSDGHIERVYNYKYPYEYIRDFEGIIERKNSILEFYKA